MLKMLSQNLHGTFFLFMFGVMGIQMHKCILQADFTKFLDNPIEVVIVCDLKFSELFQFDRDKIVHYWKAVFYDTNVRFKTIQDVKTTFIINSVRIIQNPEDQPFIEMFRTNESLLSLFDIYDAFVDFMYFDTLPRFDIPILALAEPLGSHKTYGVASFQSGCFAYNVKKNAESAVIVSVTSFDFGLTLAHEIAHVLGADHDDEKTYSGNQCVGYNFSGNYIMGHGVQTKDKKKFFSKCSKQQIFEFLTQPLSECVRYYNKRLKYIFNTATYPVSWLQNFNITMEQQCKITLNNLNAFAAQESCSFVECRLPDNSPTYAIFPLEGTPCGKFEYKNCFRGSCLSQGIYIVNVALEECLTLTANAEMNMTLAVKHCPMELTLPTEMFRLIRSSSELNRIRLALLARDNESEEMKHSEVYSKEVARDGDMINLLLKWEIRKFDAIEEPSLQYEFMLFDPQTNFCAGIDWNSVEVIKVKCDKSDDWLKWRLVLANGTMISYANVIDSSTIVDSFDRVASTTVSENNSSAGTIKAYLIAVFGFCVIACLTTIAWCWYS